MSATDRPPDIPADVTDKLLSVYLAKYGSLREELFQRFQFQGQAFNFLVVVLTALIAVGAAQFEEGRTDRFDALVLLIPLVTGPFPAGVGVDGHRGAGIPPEPPTYPNAIVSGFSRYCFTVCK